MAETDVVVVGGGIGGCALATTFAREGLGVIVLERQEQYRDQVRGEGLWPWGVAEAMHLGLADVLLQAAGGGYVTELVDYIDGDDPVGAEHEPVPLSEMVDGVPGALNIEHPVACAALAKAAIEAGAEVLTGAKHVQIDPGTRPEVRFTTDGTARRIRSRLLVGADGRNSTVRNQVGIQLKRSPASHVVAGLLVDDLPIEPGRDVAAIGDDLFMVTFSQTGGRARVYLFYDPKKRPTFNGPDGAQRFVRAAALPTLPNSDAWAQAVPAGPCRIFRSDDTWTDVPFVEGVALVGDAAGYNDPLIGEGLGLALRDVRSLSELLLNGSPWSTDTFSHYGTARAERLRRMRAVAHLYATETIAFGPSGRRLRQDIQQRIQADPTLLDGPNAMFVGPDNMTPEVGTEDFRSRYFGG